MTSELNGRKILYLGWNGSDMNMLDNIVSADWQVVLTQDIAEAESILKKNKMHVGLIEMPPKISEQYVNRLGVMLRQFIQMEWIALVFPENEDNKRLKQIIAEGFFDFHTSPVNPVHLLSSIGHAYGMSKMKWGGVFADDEADFNDIEMVGSSPQIKALFAAIRKVASVSAPLLITGESGTGKELVAHAVHERSQYADGPFITVNCGAIPHTLIQSELFGYEKGAFTGANERKIGSIESADKGTIFLDEIGDIPLDQQINLLRFLQEKTVQRVGGVKQIAVDVRVIAATHIDLEQAVADGRFREDLFYRLNVLQIHTPPLRERSGDIELLSKYFFKKFSHEKNKTVKGFSQSCYDVMRNYRWPGNIRELINRVRRAMVMCEGRLIAPSDMGIDPTSDHVDFLTLKESKDRTEREVIYQTLRRTGNNVTLTAKKLAVSRVTLYRLLEKHHLTVAE